MGLTELLQLQTAVPKLSFCRHYKYALCHTLTQQCSDWGGRGETCVLSAVGMAARELMEVVPGMRLEYDQGWGRRSQVSRWRRGQAAMQETTDPNHLIWVEVRELGGNICLYLPLLLMCSPSSCQATLHTDPSLFLSSIISSPMSHSTHSISPARGSPPDKFITSPPPPLQGCWLIRRFVTYCLPSLTAAWEADGEQKQATHRNGTLNPLVVRQRKLYSKFKIYGGFYLNSMLMSWHITGLSRHNFFSKKGNIFHWSNL